MYFASVLRWGVVTAIFPSRIGRAMSSRKRSEIDDSPMTAWPEWIGFLERVQ